MKQYGLYVHIPFCKSKCYYCDFYSVVEKDTYTLDRYIDSLDKEIVYFLENFDISHPEIITIYIGGGTPSLLNRKQINRLFHIICANFKIKDLKEITVELNPESVNESNLSEIKKLFFLSRNVRLSLGVQSFNEKLLKKIGRIHTKNDSVVAVKLFRKLGFDNYNFDFIFGLPGQKVEDVLEDLNFALQLAPTHISCYALTVEEGTYFAANNYAPDGDLQSEMYKSIVDFLGKNEYYIYEVSNFAKNGYKCLHNLNYWERKEYIGIGPSAVSFFDNKRIKNVSSVDDYINFNFKYEVEKISPEIAIKEKLMLGLRTIDGIPLEEEILRNYHHKIKKLLKEKKLVIKDNRLRIPIEYMFVSNQILVEFM